MQEKPSFIPGILSARPCADRRRSVGAVAGTALAFAQPNVWLLELNEWLGGVRTVTDSDPLFWSKLGVAAILTLVLLLISRMRRRRLKLWRRMLVEAASDLADKREYCRIAMGRGDFLNSLADAFNRVSEVMAEDEKRLKSDEARVGYRGAAIDSAHAALAELDQIADLDEMLKAAPAALSRSFDLSRVELWIQNRFVIDPNGSAPQIDDDPSRLDEPEGGEALSTQSVLDRVGLVSIAKVYKNETIEEQCKSAIFPLRPVLETATSHRAEVCTNFESSAMFQRAGLTLSEAGLVSYLSLPLKAHGQLAGVVEIYADRIVEETEARLLEIVVGQCAALIALSYNLIETRRSQENLELKNLELAMANRKLERSNNSLSQADRVKGEFLANTSHELRTPLNSILGFAQLITGGSCESDEEVRQYANAIRESGERLLKMINEVLDLAKIEAGKMNVQLGPVDVRTLFDAVKSLMGVQAGQQGNKIRAAIPDVPLPLLRADHTKLYQVLVNLVGNANKFTREGEIVLSVVPESAPGFMRIEIADTGEGIEPEQLPQLFQSFVQGDGSTTRKFGGTGLGLTISKKLIELIGGAIDLSSEGRGKGATVTLEVPLWSDELELQGATAVELAAENEPDPEARTIVIIEDYLEFQRYLAELVEAQGWRVLSARTAARGLDLIRRHKPSAIVLDMHLPSDDEDASIQTGYDILSTLAKDVEMESTPTLVVTAMHREACDALLGQTLLLPVELYSKPLDEEAFLKSLERLTAAV